MSITEVGEKIPLLDAGSVRRVVFGEVDYEPGGTFGPRVQAGIQLVMLDKGSVRITTDSQTRRLGRGEVVCQWPGGREFYAFDPRRPSRHRWVTLELDRSPRHEEAWRRFRRQCPPARRESAVMKRLFDTAFRQLPADHANAPAVRTALGLAYLLAYADQDDSPAPPGTPLPPPVAAMRDLVHHRFAEPLTLDDLAAAAAVTPSHLVRLTRQHLATTPMRLLQRTRIDRGVDLLRDTGLSIAEIAYRVGFANPYHFSRSVKQAHGHSPRELRRRFWGKA